MKNITASLPKKIKTKAAAESTISIELLSPLIAIVESTQPAIMDIIKTFILTVEILKFINELIKIVTAKTSSNILK